MRLAYAIRSERYVAPLLALACGLAAAQVPDERLRALENEVQQLKKRVDLLEGPQSTQPATPAAAANCPGWERVKMSMTQPEVRALLGEPAKVDATPLRIVWRYPCGRAYFDAETQRFVGYER